MVNFYFKLAYTSNTRTYDIDLSHTTAILYDRLKTLVQNDFGLNSFDIVIAGQDQAERAQSIPKNNSILRHILNNNTSRAFYIRNGQTSDIQLPETQLYNQMSEQLYERPTVHIIQTVGRSMRYHSNMVINDIQAEQTQTDQTQTEQTQTDECPICTISSRQTQLHTHYNCSHQICDNCYSNWRQTNYHNHNRCPICRSD